MRLGRRSFLKALGATIGLAVAGPLALVEAAVPAAPVATVARYRPVYKNLREWRDGVEAKAVATDLRLHGPRPNILA